ncbi:MAG: DUF1929 domain-containing protein [Armatimonadetes bacterium]|nr:DUF1929 domain-containing protein [Armatimonadota bacterium]
MTLLRLGSTTHGFDQGQRYINCTIQSRSGNTMTVIPPATGGVAPPGWYLMSAVNGSGVPSPSKYMKVGPP